MRMHPRGTAVALLLCGMTGGLTADPLSDREGLHDLAFHRVDQDSFLFDTGVVSGRLRAEGRGFGIAHAVHRPSGQPISRTYGLMNLYRVFANGQRYGAAAWEWPSRAVRNPDGSVTIECDAAEDRPFLLRGTYRWSGPATLDLGIEVIAERQLRGFEVFLASYYDAAFSQAAAWVGEHPDTPGAPGFFAAEQRSGTWLTFPRDRDAVRLIQDGRWQLPPSPVTWEILPSLAQPLALRRIADTGLTALTMAPRADCFAVSMPYQTEPHYSVYLSLFGRPLPAGERATARARWQLLEQFSEAAVRDAYRDLPSDAAVNPRGSSATSPGSIEPSPQRSSG